MNERFDSNTRAWLVPLSLALATFTGVAHAQFYAVTDLGTLGGTNCLAYGINDDEQIVGSSETAAGVSRGFMFDHGRMMDLGTLGGSNSWAYGINDNGWMVGGSDLPDGNEHGFLCTNALALTNMIDLGTLGGSNSVAYSINMHGEMVGWAELPNGSHHAFLLTNAWMGDMMDLGDVGGTNSEFYCINDIQEAVGGVTIADGDFEPILSSDVMMGAGGMGMMNMGGMGGLGGQAWYINDQGTAVGQTQLSDGSQRAFISASGGMMGRVNVNLGTLGGTNSTAYCINDDDEVVGTSLTSNGHPHAFIVTNALGGMAAMTDLNTLIHTNSGWDLIEARGINASNQIVGMGMFEGQTHGYLLTPVSGPVQVTSAPSSSIMGPGASLTLHLRMSAGEPLFYQWLHDGSPLPGATNSTLVIPSMGMSDAGRYTVTARNAVGTVASASVPIGMFSLMLTNGNMHLTAAAPAGDHVLIDCSDTLGPNPDWQTLTNITMVSGMVQLDDVSQAGTHARFYRAALLP
ncbi:MAG: immunoglobulin domain-containing protein [Candidatus Omnitrophica bacterium]|nr:immunoglobulin domain-containing protein [Candidatus Omnitrophota bacterium]